MRDLSVQEFLRELIVGTVAPSYLARSIIVKIFHCGESGNVEQVARTSKQFSHVCDCSSITLSQSLMFNILHVLYCLYLYLLDTTCAK